MKASAIAHPNIAFVKYWGKIDEKLHLPANGSISMTLSDLYSQTTVEFGDFPRDSIVLDGKEVQDPKIKNHLDLIRQLGKSHKNARINSRNNFPTGSGIASSASGFAALTLAACKAIGLNLDSKTLSIIARQGSGSACRSIYGGFVEWLHSTMSEGSHAIQLADEHYWDVRDLITIVSTDTKRVSSTSGMVQTTKTSPLYQSRLAAVEDNLKAARDAIRFKNFKQLGEIAEYDSLLMHATMMTTRPPLLYWLPATVKIMHAVEQLRETGVPAYYTIDAGANVHVLTLPSHEKKVYAALHKIDGVQNILQCRPGEDTSITNEHLF